MVHKHVSKAEDIPIAYAGRLSQTRMPKNRMPDRIGGRRTSFTG